MARGSKWAIEQIIRGVQLGEGHHNKKKKDVGRRAKIEEQGLSSWGFFGGGSRVKTPALQRKTRWKWHTTGASEKRFGGRGEMGGGERQGENKGFLETLQETLLSGYSARDEKVC